MYLINKTPTYLKMNNILTRNRCELRDWNSTRNARSDKILEPLSARRRLSSHGEGKGKSIALTTLEYATDFHGNNKI